VKGRAPLPGSGDAAARRARRKAARQVKRNGTVTLSEFIFHHDGKQITDIRKNWYSAIRKAGLRRLVFHTLRHTAVKVMDDCGLSRDAAMSITGHRTDAMYSRYNDFSDSKRLRSPLEKLAEYRQAAIANKQTESAQNVRSISK